MFKVTDWPKEEYGKFYNGDSYIILNNYKKKESDEVQLNLTCYVLFPLLQRIKNVCCFFVVVVLNR